MAVNNSRSMNDDLRIGMTENAFHRVTPDRGGMVEGDWPMWRAANVLRASWGRDQLAAAAMQPRQQEFDYCLRDRVSIVNGTGARTGRPTARTQFEAGPYPSPLDATYTSWPDSW